MTEVDDLLTEVARPRGCRVSCIEHPQAKEFVDRVTLLKQQGKHPNLERTSEVLQEKWGLDIPRRALSEHTRGKCSCPKK